MIGIATNTAADDVVWRNLMGAVPDAVIVSDANGQIVYVNTAVTRFFGYQPADLLGQPVEILVPRSIRGQHKSHRAGYHSEPRRRFMGFGSDLRAVRADGSEFPVAISLGYTPAPNGNLVIAIVQDLSDLRERDRSIENLTQRMARDAKLEEVNKELEAFSFSVSHDLRAPLRVVDGFSQVLREDYSDKLDDYGRDCISRIRTAAQRMGQLIDDLLNLSRITRSDMVATDVDLSAMAREIVDTLTAAYPGQKVELAIGEGMIAHGDARLLRIALENLLSNAWKFSSGQSTARIEIGRSDNTQGETFFVRDNGAGFDMAYADKLFGAFQRMHNAQSFPGTGIGLATVQRIINRHNGRVWATSEINKGATFYFTLFQGAGNGLQYNPAG